MLLQRAAVAYDRILAGKFRKLSFAVLLALAACAVHCKPEEQQYGIPDGQILSVLQACRCVFLVRTFRPMHPIELAAYDSD